MGTISWSSIPRAFTREFPHWRKVEFFRRVLYLFLLFNTLSLLPVAEDIWSYDGMVGTRGWDFSVPTYRQPGYALINVLSHPVNARFSWLYLVFAGGQLFFLVTGIFRVWPKVSSIMVWFFTVNLFLKGHMMFTGGEVLVNLLLFYLMFIQKSNRTSPGFRIRDTEEVSFSFVQNLFNNTFYLILLVQVCVLYFFSTFYKLQDPNWVSGEAVMYISRIDTFSGTVTRFLFADNYFLSAVATYLTLVYSGLFPVLVWVRKVKVPFLLVGVSFHLSIAFGMGIFSFGIIMCLAYLLFLDIRQIEYLRDLLLFRRKKVTGNVSR